MPTNRAIDYLANICVVLELTRSLSELYWMNVNDPGFPFVGVIEHTNLDQADPSGRRHIVYLSRYLPASDPMFGANRRRHRPLHAATSATHVSRSRPRMHPSHACLASALRPAFGAAQLRQARSAARNAGSVDSLLPAWRKCIRRTAAPITPFETDEP